MDSIHLNLSDNQRGTKFYLNNVVTSFYKALINFPLLSQNCHRGSFYYKNIFSLLDFKKKVFHLTLFLPLYHDDVIAKFSLDGWISIDRI